MRKFLFILLISLILSSCATTEILPEVKEIKQEEVVNTEVKETLPLLDEKEEEIIEDPREVQPEAIIEETPVEEKEVEIVEEQIEPVIETPVEDEVKEEVVLPEEEEVTTTVEIDEKETSSIGLDNKVDDMMLTSFITISVIVLLISISTIIRSNAEERIPVFIAIILALLFTLIPILTATVITGWKNMYYAYLVLLLTFFIIRGKKN